MTVFYLVRHGETVWHSENRYAGTTDVSMTPLGYEQAERLGRWAAMSKPNVVYSSDLSRAIATAEPAATNLGTETVVDARLREVDFGRAEGLTRIDMSRNFPDELAAFMANPATSPLPNGELGSVAVERAVGALVEIAAARPEDSVLVVMHTTLMRLLLCHMLGVSLDKYRTIFPEVINAAITEVRFDGKDWALVKFNAPSE
ncbi:histidine phosphatase family protein [Arthrobacter psychrolactophilus]